MEEGEGRRVAVEVVSGRWGVRSPLSLSRQNIAVIPPVTAPTPIFIIITASIILARRQVPRNAKF